ncbi:hemerythrin domain-containing protein [Streptomyces sp. RFCAC02]|uniref:hemerythrin domain-containing protein n=1 Tax=Streptomyces sp. RFCAC02 TaxID=2499143 RepID=UPI0010214ECC|nr:hemerythrin domain-containing protein [Streptomyces sp. RFCAC02]
MTQMASRVETSEQEDVVALLMRQHGDIRNLFDEVERSTGDDRRSAFRSLVQLLAVHETAEQEVVHPYVRGLFDGGDGVVDDRLAEERAAKEQLSRLDGMDPAAPGFMTELKQLRTAVTRHARAEERYEFAQIRRRADPKRLAALARGVKAAEAMAPTRPHPRVQGAAANLAAGPVAALIDRTRDAIRRAMGSDG